LRQQPESASRSSPADTLLLRDREFADEHFQRGAANNPCFRHTIRRDDGKVLSISIRGPKEQGYNDSFDFDVSA
jgi:hypothetical protein